MKFKICSLVCFVAIFLISCSNTKKQDHTKTPQLDNKEVSRKNNNVTAIIDSASIINKLIGKWKESEYPFRIVYFKSKTVKFIEEGTEKEPEFREFKISDTCPFDVNNIKNAQPEDIFFVLAESKTCEILKVSNNTLILSGFNVNDGRDYKIVYSKVE